MYQALYRKWRPKTFDDVVGQTHITETLKHQVQTGRLSHAYLFIGTRGTGKTTCAKILAKAVNCESPVNGNPCNRCAACRGIDDGSVLDVVELDAASNNGVDNVRALRDEAVFSPANVKRRVYIIDEVHMLSTSAFNALLKILEEPPEHLMFILATTELHKVPATILSRCQRFSFRRITPEDIAARLQYVSYQENIDLDDSAARVLARLADGGMRDGLSLLDQCASATVGEITAQRVYECLGIAGERTCGKMLSYVADKNTKGALELFNRLYADGKDVGALMDELTSMCRDLMILKTAPEAGISMLSGVASDEETKALVSRFSPGELVRMIGQLQQTSAGFTRSASRRMDAELCLMNLCEPTLQLDAQALNARISKLEQQLRSGDFVVRQSKSDSKEEDDPEDVPPADDADAPPSSEGEMPHDTPVGFWPDLVAQLQQELRPPIRGFFSASPQSPVEGTVRGNQVVLLCSNSFAVEMINKPELTDLVAKKASAMLGRCMTAKAVDRQARPEKNEQMERLLAFGREHADIVTIKEDQN